MKWNECGYPKTVSVCKMNHEGSILKVGKQKFWGGWILESIFTYTLRKTSFNIKKILREAKKSIAKKLHKIISVFSTKDRNLRFDITFWWHFLDFRLCAISIFWCAPFRSMISSISFSTSSALPSDISVSHIETNSYSMRFLTSYQLLR